MALERQSGVVHDTREFARQTDEGLNGIETANAEYDVLNLETPNFANGFFGTPQEITASQLLGVYNSWNALKAAAPSQTSAFRAALRTAKT